MKNKTKFNNKNFQINKNKSLSTIIKILSTIIKILCPQWARTEYRISWYSSEVGRMMNSHLLVVSDVSNLRTTAWWRRCDVGWTQAEFAVIGTRRKTQNNNKMVKKIQLWKPFDFYVTQRQTNNDAYYEIYMKTRLKWREKQNTFEFAHFWNRE